MANRNLRDIFVSFATFGDRTGSGDTLDSAKFAKMLKDCHIIDKTFTSGQADIIFTKVKTKGERKISYDQFVEALKLVADAKFNKQADGFERVQNAILGVQGPSTAGTASADASGIYSKLTDTSLYTGAHKERFDAAGHGKGLDGRDSVSVGSGAAKYHGGAVSDLSQITRPNLH